MSMLGATRLLLNRGAAATASRKLVTHTTAPAASNLSAIAQTQKPFFLQNAQIARCFSSGANAAGVQKFADEAFEFFDDNGDGFIVYSELEKAYLEKRAASQLARMFSKNGLATKGITFDLIEDMDLITAYKNGDVVALNNKITRDDFGKWVENFLENYEKFAPDATDGQQDHHE
ncbi:unnamed protein product [Amoebophrya sp. A120]|nr:unnamed protein product [Amoebophrya sp. A120]|eukprot:GSA120T00013442001.1